MAGCLADPENPEMEKADPENPEKSEKRPFFQAKTLKIVFPCQNILDVSKAICVPWIAAVVESGSILSENSKIRQAILGRFRESNFKIFFNHGEGMIMTEKSKIRLFWDVLKSQISKFPSTMVKV